jgi:hypothetical protein
VSIPLATTTITVLRSPPGDVYDEPYDGNVPADWDTVAAGVRAVIDRASGREQVAGGEQNRVDLSLVCDRCDIDHLDAVRDDRTGRIYRVVWVLDYGPHVEGGLQIVQGVL